jgi:DNA polymerase-1
LAQTLGISRGESAEIIKKYFERFKKVKEYMAETVEKAKNNGFVETIFGRRRYIQELKSSRPAIRAFGERAAINAPIQGAASDLVKIAMIQLYQEIESPMILQVHDELLFECEEKGVESQSSEIKKIMENVAKLDIPLKVNLAWGKNWEEAHS